MADERQEIAVAAAWVGLEDMSVPLANAFSGVVGPHAIFFNIGSVVPPSITGATVEEREAEARSIAFIPIKPIARIALTPAGLDELIKNLEETRMNYQNLRSALDDGEDPK